jgi:hypothetical protein
MHTITYFQEFWCTKLPTLIQSSFSAVAAHARNLTWYAMYCNRHPQQHTLTPPSFQYKFLKALFWEPIPKNYLSNSFRVQIFAVQKSRYFIVKFMQWIAIPYPSLSTPTPISPLALDFPVSPPLSTGTPIYTSGRKWVMLGRPNS